MLTPYHTLVLALAGLVVWAGPQTWEFTHRLTPARALTCMALLGASIAFVWAQTENPFLYFRF
jgi:hypothetical protein